LRQEQTRSPLVAKRKEANHVNLALLRRVKAG
jgi:hypothetical protein